MAKKITDLTAATTPISDAELVEVVQSSVSKKLALRDAIKGVLSTAAKYVYDVVNDCMGIVNDSTWLYTTTNTGSIGGVVATGAKIGVLRLSLGTNAGATASMRLTQASPFILGNGVALFQARLEAVSLSDATNTYTARIGFLDVTSGEATDGVFLRYTHSVNSGKFQFVTRSNGVETATDTGITVAATTDYVIEISVNAGATSATCTINGALVATNTTNIPTGAGRNTSAGINADRSAGTASKDALDVDYWRVRIELTTAR